VNGIVQKWCGVEGYWTWGNRAHESKDCHKHDAVNAANDDVNTNSSSTNNNSTNNNNGGSSNNGPRRRVNFSGSTGLISHAVDY
jgi:hypothetical protein